MVQYKLYSLPPRFKQCPKDIAYSRGVQCLLILIALLNGNAILIICFMLWIRIQDLILFCKDLTKFLTDFQADFTPTFLVRSWGDTSLNKKFMIIMRDIQINSVLDWINHLECFITDTVSGANCLNCSSFSLLEK